MMRFPDKMTVTARNRVTGLPVNDVAILLVLFAAQKNDYHVGPLIANEHGQVVFTRADCESAIKRAQEMFVMDYSGDLVSCRPFIEVRLHLPEQIHTMIQQYSRSPVFWEKGFSDSKRFFADLQNVKNADYEQIRVTATEEKLLANPQLELALVKKAT
jgi:hypothetical protein